MESAHIPTRETEKKVIEGKKFSPASVTNGRGGGAAERTDRTERTEYVYVS